MNISHHSSGYCNRTIIFQSTALVFTAYDNKYRITDRCPLVHSASETTRINTPQYYHQKPTRCKCRKVHTVDSTHHLHCCNISFEVTWWPTVYFCILSLWHNTRSVFAMSSSSVLVKSTHKVSQLLSK
jgi:hypothetical protein